MSDKTQNLEVGSISLPEDGIIYFGGEAILKKTSAGKLTIGSAVTITGAMTGTTAPTTFNADAALLHHRQRVITSDIEAGKTLLAAVAGYKYRLIDFSMIAYGGNAATATDVRILGTQGAGSAALAIVLVAALTRSAVVKPNTANVTILADGASFIQNDANTAITIGKSGGGLATCTGIDVLLTYALEA